MSTVRARFDGKVFVPENPVYLPIGEVVEVQYSNPSQPARGSPAAILDALKNLPKVSPEAVDEMERLIEEGTSKATSGGVFDDLRNAEDKETRGS